MSGRGDLLEAIKQGKKLRKTVTNDRSAPNVGGSVVGGSSSSSTLPKRGFNENNPQQRLPGIGGLFADGMPKLKSTNHQQSHNAAGTYRRGELPSKFGSTHSVPPPPPSATNPFSKDQRRPTLSIPKKSEAPPPPPPPPLAHKPSFPNRTRSFNTGQHHSSQNASKMTLSKDDSSVKTTGPSRRPMKPPNHPPPPPPIPKRLSVTTSSRSSVEESFEMRFAGLFKPMSLFPPPEPFTCIQKTYPSKNQARKAAVSRS